ncbi:DoxX family protein [Amycolatopsis sp. cmx-4-61]|uniref:DoxX family protein n=1 Tax=Amycolatopsis sp. cmx-4-61 TaxID=2790937 RepID=UPI00397D1953
MFTTYLLLTLVAAAACLYAAAVDILRAGWVLDNMAKYGVPPSWLLPLGLLKAVGAVGLLAGLAVPVLGIAAAVGLILFFLGAVVTVTRAHWYSHLLYPVSFLVLAGGSLALRVASA